MLGKAASHELLSHEDYVVDLSDGTTLSAAPERPAAPQIQLLGPPRIVGALGDVEPSKRVRLTELAAYIKLRPCGDHYALDEAIWPGERVCARTRNTAVCKLRRWLGRDPEGHDYLPHVCDGNGYALQASVATDWAKFRAFAHDGLGARSDEGTDLLRQALALVRGQPFGGVRPSRYQWAESLKQQMIGGIIHVAHELSARFLESGQVLAARQVAARGLDVEPASELLYRDLFRGFARGGNRTGLRISATRLTELLYEMGCEPEPETTGLIDLLLGIPRRQRSA